MPATIDISRDYKVFDFPRAVTLTNPDGTTQAVTKAIKRNVPLSMAMQGEMELIAVTARWHVFVAELSGFVPKVNGSVTDAAGDVWYIGAVSLDTWETRYSLDTMKQAGQGST